MGLNFNINPSIPPKISLLPSLLGSGIFTILLVFFLVVGTISSFYTVQPEERAVVKRLGAVIKITDPGLRFKLPFGIDTVQLVATERVLKEEFGFRSEEIKTGRTRYSSKSFQDESLMLTGDLNMIDLEWVVQYRINDPVNYIYKIRDARRTLRDVSESVMRRVVGNRLGSEVLTTARIEMQIETRDEIQEIMDTYQSGIHIITVELQDVVPPARVQAAFNEVNEARQERERTINEAQKQVNQEIPRAEGAAMRQIAEAEGYAIERVNKARGESARFLAVLDEYKRAPQVTRTRFYLETMRDILPKMGQILVVQDGQTSPLPLLNIKNDEGRNTLREVKR